jgi:hypothetical protein
LGIQSLELKWFESYLSDRKQFVQKWYGFWPEPVVIVAIWRINREVVHGQSTVSGQAAPMLHVFSS